MDEELNDRDRHPVTTTTVPRCVPIHHQQGMVPWCTTSRMDRAAPCLAAHKVADRERRLLHRTFEPCLCFEITRGSDMESEVLATPVGSNRWKNTSHHPTTIKKTKKKNKYRIVKKRRLGEGWFGCLYFLTTMLATAIRRVFVCQKQWYGERWPSEGKISVSIFFLSDSRYTEFVDVLDVVIHLYSCDFVLLKKDLLPSFGLEDMNKIAQQ